MESQPCIERNRSQSLNHLNLIQTQQHDDIEEIKKLSNFRQIRDAFIANAAVIHPGLMFSFSAVALPQLQALNSPIPITIEEASWIASVASFATPPGCLLGGVLMERFGRRAALLILSLPCVLGWLLLAASGLLVPPDFALPVIYFARVLQGLGTGIVAGTSRVYTSEISTPELRGSLCSLASLGVSTGVLLGYTLGAMFTWPFMALFSALVPLTSVTLAFIYLPETPTWLLQNRTLDEARKALVKLRDPTASGRVINKELSILGGDVSTEKLSKMQVLSDLSTLKPLLLVMFYFFSYQFSGISVLTFYNVTITEQTGAGLNGYISAVVFGVIRWCCTLVGCFILHHYDRRNLTLFSGVCSGLAMLGLGSHNYLYQEMNINIWKYFPIACVCSFYVTYSLGYLLIPWVLLGEIFPAKVRGFLGGMSACFSHVFLFSAVKSFPFLMENLHFYGAFWFYGSIASIGSVILFILLPETRNRTLLDIEGFFKPKKILTSSI
ncbi:hypothetical protein B566_EDAN008765 [Ephemera danica]|nr:hypothetical protein B566_EDAN008765 [Ephemera danica]